MDKGVPSDLQKWLRKCLRKEFGSIIQSDIDKEQSSGEIAHRLTQSRDMASLLNSMKMVITEQYVTVKPSSAASRTQSSLSFTSDLMTDDWATSPQGEEGEQHSYIIEKISRDKPVHVRLAGYEILLKIDLSNVNNSPHWDVLQKALLDGLTDDSRAIFEASMQVHAKLLSSVQMHSIYGNLLNAFNAQYHSQKVRETLPTLISGINFKFFLHEKLFCIMHLIIRYQEELLKSVRHIDKTTEDIVEQFVIFLSTHSFGNTLQPKTLNMLNVISVVEPQAKWSKRWLHGLSIRRTFVAALARSPTFLQNVVECVQNGLRETPCSLSAAIVDEGNDLCIPGNTIETVTYLHCLVFVSQLCSYETGRALLTDGSLKAPFEIANFFTELSRSLNKLATEAPSGVYDTCRHALRSVLNVSEVLYNAEFYHATLCHLTSLPGNDVKIWPHTLDVISHMLDTADGPEFLTTDCKQHSSASSEGAPSKCPVAIFVLYASNLLKQPFSIMDMECILGSFGLMEKLFDVYDVYEAAQVQIETQFYPAVANFYKKMNKYGVENENKIQQLDSAVKKVLLKMVSIPLGLQALVNEKLVFEELIRGLIVPLRASWSSTDIVSFISSAGYFDLGYKVLADLAPHVLSTLVSQICANVEDPAHFYDPWDRENIKEFLHILTLFSLNFNCFAAFMVNDESDNEEKDYPSNLSELLQTAVNEDSSYHHLGLLSLNAVIWNLDAYVHLVNSLNFEDALLNIQKESTIMIEVREEQADNEMDYERSMIDDDDGNENYEPELTKEYVIDDSSLLRYDILLKSYYVAHKRKQYAMPLEEYQLFSEYPPPRIYADTMNYSDEEYDSELNDMLQEKRPGLLDIGWVSQVRAAHKASRYPMKNSVITNLLSQMHKAIPTAEWVEQFVWQENITYDADYWVAEDAHAINVALSYAEQQRILKNDDDTKQNLRQFIHSAYMFIQYNKPSKFEGFDWFLATVFIICDGDLDKCKTFIMQLIQFPSTLLLWPKLGHVMDERNNENTSSQFTFMQVLEAMVNIELPNIKYALKNDIAMLLGNSSVERDSSFRRDLHPVPARLHGIPLRVAFGILSGASAGGFNERENVAGKYGVRRVPLSQLHYLHG
ncbi:PREDICTED: protein broad-minded-like isoform X2 [Dinoponera quadriceps]|uniref:Protein broad-minded-like isoform X2 n=1 Tax=Dinoponera quadriceps TaxID=609295 RepID=A0A6P3Y1L2_DINQU|nr:PREDICTED: protein broad-minded-like isoform X2 [Dinoponera quadriceps]